MWDMASERIATSIDSTRVDEQRWCLEQGRRTRSVVLNRVRDSTRNWYNINGGCCFHTF